MHKRALQTLKRMFMHVSGPPPPYFDGKKKQIFKSWFFVKILRVKTRDMHKRAFQALKRKFIHISYLPIPYFDF